LDGIDEVRDSNAFLLEISRVLKSHPNVNAFVTSRMSHPLGDIGSSIFSKVEIAPLSDAKIRNVLQARFKGFYEKVRDGLNKSPILSDLIRNPLLLEIFSRVVAEYDISAENTNPSALIEIFVEQELSEFNSRKVTGKASLVDIKAVIATLEKLSVYCAIENKSIVSPDELTELVVSTLNEIRSSIPKEMLYTRLLELPFISISLGGICFSHLMFFEYFLAKSIVSATGKEEFSISLPAESIRTKVYFKSYESKEAFNGYLSNKLRDIGAYDTGTDVIYAKAGSLDLGLAIVLAPGIIYCFMKFADSFFNELGKATAQRITKADGNIEIPPYIENELPDWILNNEELKKQYLIELSRKYAENVDIQSIIDTDPKMRSREFAEIAVCVALKDEKRGISVSAYRYKS
jgi:hypothetical protein